MNPAEGSVRPSGTRAGLRTPSLALLTLLLLSGAPGFAQEAPQEEDAPESPRAERPEQAAPGEGTPEESEKPEPEILLPRPGVENLVIYSSGVADQHLDEAVSMTTFSPEDLKSLRIQNIEDLADYTPGLEINTRTAASNPTLFIRGIGLKDYNANAASAVAIYQDGININAPAIQLLQLFDTESVDVRRGPQGGAEGRGATAGAIHINSRLPEDEFEMSGSITAGNYEALDVEGFVNLPIVEDTLAARFAFTFNEREGTTENACADWNPRDYPQFQDIPADEVFERTGEGSQGKDVSFVLTPEALRAEYLKDKAAGNNSTIGANNYTIGSTARPNRQNRINQAGTGDQAVELRTDDVCIVNEFGPGSIVTANGEAAGLGPEGTYLANFGVPQLSDFQGLDKDVNDIDNWASRAILRWNPTDEMEWILNVHNFRNTGDSARLSMIGAQPKREALGFDGALQEDQFSEENAAENLGREGTENAPGVDPSGSFGGSRGDDPFLGYYNRDGKEELEEYGSSLKGTWDLEGATLTSLTGFETYDRSIDDEADASPVDAFPSFYNDEAYQVSQELRARGASGPWSWGVGGFVLYEYLTARNFFPAVNQFIVDQKFSQRLLSLAPYLSARYELTEEVGIEGGFRYNVEQKEFKLQATSVGVGSGEEVPEIGQQAVEETWTAPTGELKLTYAPLWSWLDPAGFDDLNLYVKGARGFKGGHFNGAQSVQADVTEKTQVISTDPEYIWSVEGGLKSRVFDDRVTLTAAAYRYWYQDLQVFDYRNEVGELPTQQLLNSDALVWGAEIEIDARPFEYPVLEGLRVQGAYTYTNSEFEDFTVTKTVTTGPRGPGTQSTFDYSGNPLISSPEHSLHGILRWELPLFGYGTLTPQWSFTYRSKAYLDPQKLDPISQPAYWLHNASLTYLTEGGTFEVSGWVDNLTDEFYKDDAFDLSREFNTILEAYNDPRTYGVTFTVTW